MAGSKVKGINIKIGADTTGLDKALSSIEGKSKSARSELVEVNRSLKTNKDSVVLWEQKQQLLSKAFDTSKEKLNMLESAQRDVNKQLEDKAITGEQYRAFQRELENARAETNRFGGQLEEAENKVKELKGTADNTAESVYDLGSELVEVDKSLKNNKDSVVLWEQKQELLSKAIEESREKVKILEETQDQIKEKFSKGEIDDGQYRAFQREVEDARAETKRFGSQLEEAENKVKELKGTADKTAESVYDLGSELVEVDKSLKNNKDSVVLWEQKQELLSKAIEESREKVKILEEAQDQIKEKFLNHEIDDGQYRAFQRELENARTEAKRFGGQLEETENKIKDLNGAADKSGDSVENLGDELAAVDKSLKNNKDSVVLWEQKQQLLSKAFDTSKEKLNMLESAQRDVNKQLEYKAITGEQYRAFQRELESARAETKRFGGQLEEAENKVKELKGTADKTAESAHDLGDDLHDAGEKAEKSSGGYTVLKGTLANLAAEGIKAAADAFKNCTEQAMEFGTSIAKVNTIADGSVSIEKMEEDIMNLSNTTGIAAGDISNAVYDAISAGQRTEDAVGFVKNATDLARAGFADTGNSLDLLTTILNAYGLESEKAVEVSDVLIQTQNLGKTTVGELSAAMGKVIPTANSCGVSLEQLAAAYAVMTSNGVATAETTTYINSMLNELSKSGTKSSDTLKEKTGKSFQELIAEGKSLSDVLAIISEAAVTPTVDTEALEKAENKVRTSKINVENAQIKLNTAVEKYGENSSQAATAANNLEKAQIALQTAESDLNGMQEEQNKSFIDMWGSAEAGKAGLILLGDSAANYNSVLEQMKNSSGATETALGKLNTKSHDLEIVQNKLKNTSIKAGKEILASMTPLVEKALPKVESMIDVFNKNLPKMISYGKTLIPVAKGIGAAFAAWKIYQKANEGVDSIKKLFDSMKKGDSIMKTFNATLKANPLGTVATAVGTVTTAVGAATTAVDFFREKAKRKAEDKEKSLAALVKEEYKEAAERISDCQTSMKEMKDSFNEQAGTIEAETGRTQALWDQLQDLADVSGKVKDADKVRAEYILGELNDALGTEYTMTGNQIKNYQTMRTEIDELIEKKRALAIIDRYSADSVEYEKLWITAREEYAKAKTEYDDYYRQMENIRITASQRSGKYFADEVELGNFLNSLDETGYDLQLSGVDVDKLKKLREDYNKILPDFNKTRENMENAQKSHDEATEYFNKQDEIEIAASEGRYDDVARIVYGKESEYVTAYKNATDDKERAEAFKKALTEQLNALDLALKSGRSDAVKATVDTMSEIVKDGKQYGCELGDEFTSGMKTKVKEMVDDGFDVSGIVEMGQECGIDTGKIWSGEFKDLVQAQINSGYDIRKMLAWGETSGGLTANDYNGKFGQEVQNYISAMYPDTTGLMQWAIEQGISLGELFGESFRSYADKYMEEQFWENWDTNGVQSITSAADSARYYAGVYGIGNKNNLQYYYPPTGETYFPREHPDWAAEYGIPMYAKGGFLGSGQGIVAEAGPELIEIMNGGAKITPLTGNARNTAVSGADGNRSRVVYINNTINANVSGSYDVRRLAEDLAGEQRRVERNMGL